MPGLQLLLFLDYYGETNNTPLTQIMVIKIPRFSSKFCKIFWTAFLQENSGERFWRMSKKSIQQIKVGKTYTRSSSWMYSPLKPHSRYQKKNLYQKQFLIFWVFTKGVSPAGNYINNRNTRTRCKLCWELTIKTPERRHVPH